LEEDRTETTASRKIEFTFSDNAIEKATPLFGAKLPLPRITSQVPISIVEDRIALPSPGQFDELLDETKEKTLPTQVIKPAGEDTGLSTLFDKDSQGTLIAQVKDFKGSSRKQQQERFILLYTGAYYIVK
jgi:hypothetical protein